MTTNFIINYLMINLEIGQKVGFKTNNWLLKSTKMLFLT